MKIFFLVFIFSLSLWAGEFVPSTGADAVLEQGKIFKVKYHLAQNETLSDEDWTKIDKEHFSEAFYLVDSEKVTNSEYLLHLVLKKDELPPMEKISIGGKDFSVTLTGFSLLPKNKENKDFVIREQEDQFWSKIPREVLYVSLAAFLLLAYPIFKIGRKIYLKNKKLREQKLKKEYWKSLFYSAHTRSEFELIGKGKKDWERLLKTKPPEVEKFLTELDEHQYKKMIGEQEMQSLKKSLNGIKDVFDRYGV